MGLFDDPEMQLIGFEQAGINNAKHYAPQQDQMGLLHPPSFDIPLDTLSGAPKRYIHWGPSGAETGNYRPNIDPTMAKFFRGSEMPGLGSLENPRSILMPSLINLSPNQDPLFRSEEAYRTMMLYKYMTPEEIKNLHYTDAASFPATSDADIAHKNKMAQMAEAYLERQRAIQDFRIGNDTAQKLAGRLEIAGAQQRMSAVLNWGDEMNSIYLKNLKKYIKENPGLGDALDSKMMTPESFVQKYGVPSNATLFAPDPDTMKQRRGVTLDMIDQWRTYTKKHGLTPERFTPGTPTGGMSKFNTGGFLLGLANFLGEIGQTSRLLQGGQWGERDGEVDVYLPSEINPPDERIKKLFGEGIITNEDGSVIY